jgi:hypothetical protein
MLSSELIRSAEETEEVSERDRFNEPRESGRQTTKRKPYRNDD